MLAITESKFEITTKLRILKTRYFGEKIALVKFPMAYWNFIMEASNPVRRNPISFLESLFLTAQA